MTVYNEAWDIPKGEFLSPEEFSEFESRLQRLRALMAQIDLDGVILAEPRPGDTRWLTGFAEREFRSTVDNPVQRGMWTKQRTGIDQPFELKTYVVVPASGEPMMVLNPGSRGNYAVAARRTSWIQRVLGTTSEDPDWGSKYFYGHMSPLIEEDLARAIDECGLSRGRIGLLGTWTGIERTKARFPAAHFAPAQAPDPLDGVPRDLMTLLTTTCSPYELRQMERASAAWEASLLAFRDLARPGKRVLDAVNDAQHCLGQHGSYNSWLLVGTGSPTNQWTWLPSEMQHPEWRFRDGDLVSYLVHNEVGGSWIQCIRSWVIGRATKAQARVLEASKRAYDQAFEMIRPGVRGEDVWAACTEVVRAAGVRFSGKLGHSEGRPHNIDHRFDLFDRSPIPLPEGLAITIHPPCHDTSSEAAAYLGEVVVVEKTGCRTLSPSPVLLD